MTREGGEEDSLLQLSEAWTCHCRLPDTKSKPSTSKKPYKKKALKATWDLESESEEEVDIANMCFMTNDNTPKVFSEPSLEDCDLTMDELGEAFKALFNNYDFLKKSI